MTDIVERLRKQRMISDLQSGLQPHYVCLEAADEIERLREALHKEMDHLFEIGDYDRGYAIRDILGEGK